MSSTCDCNACGEYFVNKIAEGPCQKCIKLNEAAAAGDDIAFQQVKNTPQCEACGVTFQNLTNSTCGFCRRKTAGAEDLVQKAVDDAAQNRANATQARFSTGRAKNPLVDVANNARGSNDVTMEALLAHKQVLLNPNENRTIHLFHSSRLKDKKSIRLGAEAFPVPHERIMDEVKESLVAFYNRAWLEKYEHSLSVEDITLKFLDGISTMQGSDHLTIGGFYNLHRSHPIWQQYWPKKVPPQWLNLQRSLPARCEVLYMEVWIDEEGWAARTGLATTMQSGKGRKGASAVPQHVRRASGAMPSQFRTTAPANGAAVTRKSQEPIELKVAKVSVSSVTGEVEYVWEAAETLEGFIKLEALGRGKTKRVWECFLGQNLEHYVVKKFYDIGSGGMVSAKENAACVQNEVTRARQGKWLWKEFVQVADNKGVEICQDIEWAEVWLAIEVVKDGTPSKASQFDAAEDASLHFDQDQPILWMLEKKRSSATVKYSGTMDFPLKRGQLNATLYSWTHYAYATAGLVFADLQGTPTQGTGGGEGTTLFDVMTHSKAGNTGIGDHGLEGINAFKTQHDCHTRPRSMCERLGIPLIHGPQEDVDGDDESTAEDDE